MHCTIYPITDFERTWVLEATKKNWEGDFIVTRGRKVYPAKLEGFYATSASGEKIGLITYEIIDDQCEIITLDAFHKFCGVGTELLEKVRSNALEKGCRRLWLITTNDNLDAMRFYQRRGFAIAAIHTNAIFAYRKIKPSITEIGMYEIPLRDEIKFEMMLK